MKLHYTIFISADEEDWRGKNPRPRKIVRSRRAIHSILDPSVEAYRKTILLRNGSYLSGKNPIHTYNTCPFDSVYAVFAALYADREDIRTKIDHLQSNCAFSKMVASMFSGESKLATKHKSLVQQRSEILSTLFEGSQQKTLFDGLTSIDCACNVNYLTPKLLPTTLYSLLRIRKCDKCEQSVESYRCYLDIDIFNFETKPMSELNSSILDS